MSVFPFHDIDLSLLPPPEVLESLDYEQLLEQRKQIFNGLQPAVLDEKGQPVKVTAELVKTESETYWKIPADPNRGLYYLNLESDPVMRLLQADVYRELIFRQRINHIAPQTMIAYATGNNLDHLGANYGLKRLVVQVAKDNQPEVLETDEAFRKRLLLVAEGHAKGGSLGWYLFNTLSASGLIKDAHVTSPEPCHITVTIMSHENNGVANAGLLKTVNDYLHSRFVRVLGDVITVRSVEPVLYTLKATIETYTGPSTETVFKTIRAAWAKYQAQSERIGHALTRSGVDAALHQAGVYRATIQSPELPITIGTHQAPVCIGLELTQGERHAV